MSEQSFAELGKRLEIMLSGRCAFLEDKMKGDLNAIENAKYDYYEIYKEINSSFSTDCEELNTSAFGQIDSERRDKSQDRIPIHTTLSKTKLDPKAMTMKESRAKTPLNRQRGKTPIKDIVKDAVKKTSIRSKTPIVLDKIKPPKPKESKNTIKPFEYKPMLTSESLTGRDKRRPDRNKSRDFRDKSRTDKHMPKQAKEVKELKEPKEIKDLKTNRIRHKHSITNMGLDTEPSTVKDPNESKEGITPRHGHNKSYVFRSGKAKTLGKLCNLDNRKEEESFSAKSPSRQASGISAKTPRQSKRLKLAKVTKRREDIDYRIEAVLLMSKSG